MLCRVFVALIIMMNKNGERRGWSEAEDRALKELYEELKLNRWSLIAQQLEQKYGFGGRTGKQCRERCFLDYADPGVCHEEWVLEEEKRLYQLHDELGNKWAIISHRLGGGRTDNSVKNHYYSKLRKSLRKLNKVIHTKHKKQFREIQTKVLYKIIEASEEKFKPDPMVDSETSEEGRILKNRILMFSYDQGEPGGEDNDDEMAHQLILEINEFNRNYKRKPKRFRKLGAPNIGMLDNIDSEECRQRIAEKDFIEQKQADERGSFLMSRCNYQDEEDEEEDSPSPQKIRTQQKKLIIPIILTGHQKMTQFTDKEEKGYEQEGESKEVRVTRGAGPQILEELGLLQDDLRLPHPFLTKKATSQMSKMSSQPQQSHEEFKFFEDSQNNELRFMCAPLLTATKKESQFIEDKLFQE